MKHIRLSKFFCVLLALLTVTSAVTVISPLTAKASDGGNIFACEGVPVKKLTIAGYDLSEYVIIHGDNGAFIDCAEHLARYLLSATGIDVPLKMDTETPVSEKEIRVGYTDRDTPCVSDARASLGEDGYLILSDGASLFITGQTARGTCNGVYSFLEDYVGVRFFTRTLRPALPADLVEVPGDLNVSYVPPFSYRRDNWPDTLDNWVCANKLNGNTGTFIGGGVGNIDYENKYGSVNFYSFTSTIGVWTETSGGINRQPCLSDEKNYRNALKNIREALSRDPGAKLVSVTPYDSDVNVGGCHCDACRAVNDPEGSEMATLLLFCNRLAEDLRDDYPDVKIETIAYHYTAKPPKTIRPSDRVIVQYAPIKACYAHPLAACDSTAYGSAESCEYLKAWAEICAPGNLWIWDYNAGFGYTFAPFTNYDVLYENIRTYAALGVGGVFMECVAGTELGQFTELNHYLLGKLLWDPHMTKETYYRHMDEFLQAWYGEAWSFVRTYIDKLTLQQSSGHYGIWDTVGSVWHLPEGAAGDAIMGELRGLWEAALAAVPAESEYRAHVEKSYIHALYADLYQKTQARCSLTDLNELRRLMNTYEVTSLGAHSRVSAAQVFSSLPVGSADLYQDRTTSPDPYYVMDTTAMLRDASFINDCEMTEMTEGGVTFLRMEGKRDPYVNYPNGTVSLNQGARYVVMVYRSDKEQTGRMYSLIATVNGRLVTTQMDFPLENTEGEFKCVLVEFSSDDARAANDFRLDPVDGTKIKNVSLDVAGLRFFFNEEAALAFIKAFEAGELETQPETDAETMLETNADTESETQPLTSTEPATQADATSADGNQSGEERNGCRSALPLVPGLILLCAVGMTCGVLLKKRESTGEREA